MMTVNPGNAVAANTSQLLASTAYCHPTSRFAANGYDRWFPAGLFLQVFMNHFLRHAHDCCLHDLPIAHFSLKILYLFNIHSMFPFYN